MKVVFEENLGWLNVPNECTSICTATVYETGKEEMAMKRMQEERRWM